jgi:PAS domain S-box-containing protein
MKTGPTILVVEDNPITRKMLRVTLETEDYRVIEAADGRGALAACEAELPDLVLQDLILPDTNGFELVRRLRAFPGASSLPILALSGFLGRIKEAETVEGRFTALLVKPIEPFRLLDVVRTYFPTRSIPSPKLGAGQRILVVDDEPKQLKRMRAHFTQLGFNVDVASGGAEALRVARARRPDAILSSALLPVSDGFQLCAEVRRDPALAQVPFVLLSPWYETEADHTLARRVGASALTARTQDFAPATRALHEALEKGPAAAERAPDEVAAERLAVVSRQFERQLALNGALARRCTLQAAQISLLSGLADALTRKVDTNVTIRDVLAATLDAAGISKGAIYLRGPNGALVPRHGIGFSPEEVRGLNDFFGHLPLLERLVAPHAVVLIPSADVPAEAYPGLLERAGVTSLQVVPLVFERRGAGAIVLGTKHTDLASDDSIAFVRAMGNQLVQSLEATEAFAKLTDSEQRYRSLMENASDAISILTLEGVIREVNRRMCELLGYASADLVGRPFGHLARPTQEAETARSFGESIAPGSGRTPPIEVGKADGEVVLIEFSNAVIEIEREKLVLSVGRDVTEQTRAQAQLMVADRMASIGTLAAGVAHEINNPLAAVTANLDLALQELADLDARAAAGLTLNVDELRAEIRDAREAAEQVRDIVRDIKTFSRAEDEKTGPVDVHRVIDSSLRMAWNEIRHRARLTKDFGDVPLVMANESRLGQVFLNLIVNAAQAIPEGQADANEIRVRTRLEADRKRVAVEVTDTGPGIPPEVRRRLFTPFFTTKPVGVGTGLGLAICHRIVSGLGGEISVSNGHGCGVTFRVAIPVANVTRAEPSPPSVARAAERRGRVLVVDDERLVGVALRRMLCREHDVEVVTSAADALARLLQGPPFDVILCDLMMPVTTGMDLHAELVRSAPDQAERIVFLTGGAFTPRARAFLDGVPNSRLEKPFTMHTLRELVNERLG